MTDAAIEVDHVRHCFDAGRPGQEPTPVLDDVSLSVADGEFLGIVGPSGCGKSTLLNMIAGLITADEGRIFVKGRSVRGVDASMNLGYMFARDGLMPWRTTLDNVAFGLQLRGRRDWSARGRELMAMVGLAGFERHYRSELSQGMRQRAALARTLASDPEILLLDEPFGALDAQTKVLVEEEFMRIRDARGNTVVFVTHDLMEAITLADQVIVMSSRPARIKASVPVHISRPRSLTKTRFDPEAQKLYVQLWEALKPEALRTL